jgi:hypothetical protein
MSLRSDEVWTKGETWTEEVTCTDADGQPLNPTSANFRLKVFDTDVVVVEMTEVTGITIAGNVCTYNVPQDDVDSGVYWRRLKVTAANGSVSRQVHGFVEILAED